jgi:CheY-like chemotaxis protein
VPEVLLDPLQLEQVLMNLCINARDAMQGHGTLTVGLHQVTLGDDVCASCRQPVAGAFIEIAVSDTGSGIPAGVQERMFEPFYSTKAVGHGSGMGLPMVHGIIHELDGHLLLDSRPGEGASLCILLPPLSAAEAGATSDASGDTRPDRQRLAGQVLLVDDEPAVGEFMQDLLEDWGLTVSVFSSSIDACMQFSDDPDCFDLVILDQTMPRMSGMQVAQQLLGLRPDLPVILYTGYSDEITEEQVIAAGVRALLSKPVDTVALYRLVERLLSTRPAGRDSRSRP